MQGTAAQLQAARLEEVKEQFDEAVNAMDGKKLTKMELKL